MVVSDCDGGVVSTLEASLHDTGNQPCKEGKEMGNYKSCWWKLNELASVWYVPEMRRIAKFETNMNHNRSGRFDRTTIAFHFGLKFYEHWDFWANFGGQGLPAIEITQIDEMIHQKKHMFAALYEWSIKHRNRVVEELLAGAVGRGVGGLRTVDPEGIYKKPSPSLNSPMSKQGKSYLEGTYYLIRRDTKNHPDHAEILEELDFAFTADHERAFGNANPLFLSRLEMDRIKKMP